MHTLPTEPEHLVSARTGNPEAFTALVEPYRQPLLVHCYRLSGSLDDAEDIVQETLLRAWGKLKTFEGQGSFRNWLYVIATHLWLDEARKRTKRVLLPLDGDPADPDAPLQPPTSPASWLDPLPGSWLSRTDPSPESFYERRETLSLAFMVALQKLNPRQRVVLILREVFNWSAEEVANALGLSVDSVNNLLYRARKNLAPPSFKETSASKHDLAQFVEAWESGDVHGLVKLLHDKATFAMPPMGLWFAGRDSIQRALQNLVFVQNAKWKLLPTSANGNPAFGIYREEGENYRVFGLLLPVFAEDKFVEVTAFLTPQLAVKFRLPPSLSP